MYLSPYKTSTYYLIQIITIMFKRSVTPLNKDKPLIRNTSNHQKAFKDVKNNAPTKQVLSRNPSNSKITFTNQSPFTVQGVNPESPDKIRLRESAKNSLINDQMRYIVVEWMLQISHRAVLRRQTIFMAVHLLDAVLQKIKNVSTHNLQLVAIAAFFIAAKYEQIYPQNLHKFLQYTAHSYNKQQLLQMQEKILGEMDFKLTFPTRITHFGMLSQSNPNLANSKKYQSLCLFLLQMSLFTRFEDTKDEDIAEAASFLAKKVLKMPTGWTSDAVMQIAYRMMGVWRQNEKSVLAYFYDNQKYCFVGGLKLIY